MCQFKSGIVLRSEGDKGGFKLLMSPWTEHHEDLITIHKLKDTRLNFARVEFSPESMETAHKVETYKLKIDDERRPEWFDAEMEELVVKKMADYIQSIIVDSEVCLLLGGQFILATGAVVRSVKACHIVVMCDSSTVGEMWGSSIVGEMLSSSKVGVMRDSSKVGVMWDSSTVGVMWDSSKVGENNSKTK
jgi:hypothetical protein